MREPRLDEIIAILRAHGRATASDLAERLGVTVRTIQRDVDELSRRGVPVYADRGRGGGYRLLPGYRPPAADLTDAETLALFLPGGDHPAGALGLDDARRTAMSKLSCLLDDDRNRRATLLQERLLVVPDGWREPVPPPEALRTVFAAVTGNHVVEIDYAPVSGSRGPRRCLPLGVVLAGTHWYLLARKSVSGGHRTYRIDRMRGVRRTGERFTRSPSDDLARLWDEARETAAESRSVEVVVRTRRRHLVFTRPMMELVCRSVHLDTIDSRADDPDDAVVEIRGLVASVRAAAGFLGGLGAFAEVVHPPELRAALADIADENSALYRPLSTSAG